MITRRRLFLGTASVAAAGALLRPRLVRAQTAGFESEIEALEQRARGLGIPTAQATAKSLGDEGDAFTDAKDRLLDLMDASDGRGAEGRALGEDAGDVLARITAEESQTPKAAKDTVNNTPAQQRKFKFDEETRKEYRDLFASCVIDDAKRSLIERDARRLLMVPRYPAYKDIEARTNVPWYFVAAVHNLEGSLNMSRHLHNGDPLRARTVQVPAGRPKVWDPPTDWASSAVDALSYEGFTSAATMRRGWSLEAMLYRFERYNGVGSRRHGINTPYLWSYTNHYRKGKYVADGVWSDDAVSKQCGAVALLKVLIEKGAVETPKFYVPPA